MESADAMVVKLINYGGTEIQWTTTLVDADSSGSWRFVANSELFGVLSSSGAFDEDLSISCAC